jgi:hypothetical protein
VETGIAPSLLRLESERMLFTMERALVRLGRWRVGD